MIDHLHPQRLSYNTVNWVTTKLKLLFEKVCKNSVFDLVWVTGATGNPIFYHRGCRISRALRGGSFCGGGCRGCGSSLGGCGPQRG